MSPSSAPSWSPAPSVISIQTVTVSLPVPTTITVRWTATIPSSSTILVPTGVATPTPLARTPINTTQSTFPCAPTSAACQQNNGTLTHPDGVVQHLILCGTDWEQGTAKYSGVGVGQSHQYTYEGCSKSCVGDQLGLCRAFVYSNNVTDHGMLNCFLRKLGNITTIEKAGFWGGVVFKDVEGGGYTLG